MNGLSHSKSSSVRVQPVPSTAQRLFSNPSASLQPNPQLPQEVIAELINGILILTDRQELIYANEEARRILEKLNPDRSRLHIPQEIWHICQSLIRSRSLFPNQHWLIESEIFTDESTTLHVRARWFNLEHIEYPCLLLIVEDQYQAIKNIALEEAQKYGLTAREKEIWLLHRANATYKKIATELTITPNTVKKHMRSIHAKQKLIAENNLEV
ncbi:LuxR C-terminal-related transcriptional regulator [Alkalinema sp. FACHB-956]|uniref:helix-turn-helix transcriptional regulator n=1 Tax=Alkalinema sp. FACHB-956 TaxID=2692768 RepID=UPI001688001B|nr:LuxR C-terminal-related transcriptional regulator [Alkalinema sp. FACHB-956]MBD2326318.1 helix-turn-helix transcriptional regulator [Alkalinema sp. FACHB-956]